MRAVYQEKHAVTEIWFYHLQSQPLERVLPTLLEKSLEKGWRVALQARSEERLEALAEDRVECLRRGKPLSGRQEERAQGDRGLVVRHGRTA